MSSERPLLAISSCLLGQRVRYDGEHKRDRYITESLAQQVDWKPICPEVAIGMGVPRPPIQLVGDARRARAVGVDDPSLDVTESLRAYAHRAVRDLQDVSGYIFKSRSPSCGVTDAKLFAVDGRESGLSSGVYARVIQELLPMLPVVDECQLQDVAARETFLERVFAHWRLQKGCNAPDVG